MITSEHASRKGAREIRVSLCNFRNFLKNNPFLPILSVFFLAAAASAQEAQLKWHKGYADKVTKQKIGALDPRNDYEFQVELTSRGAAINTVKLSEYFETDLDKHAFNKDPDSYLQKRMENPEKYKGHYSILNPVASGGKSHLPLATKSITVKLPDQEKGTVFKLDKLPWLVHEKPTVSADGKSQSASFKFTLYRSKTSEEALENPILRVIKTYVVSKGDYSIAVSLKLENLSDMPLKVSLNQMGPSGLQREGTRADVRQAAYGKLMAEDKKVETLLMPRKKLDPDDWPLNKIETLGSSEKKDPVLWVGNINKFFGSMMYLVPSAASPETLQAPEYRARFYLGAAQEGEERTYLTGIRIPEIRLKAGQAKEVDFDLFAGPKSRKLFKDAGAHQLYRKLNYLGTIDFGSCCPIGSLPFGMMWLLDMFSIATLGNYGLAIILLVVLVRVVLHPLTKKGQVSMMGMQKMGPEMQKLKEKYADDKETLQRETMRMYKEKGFTPFLGCLPMLLQMPIWIALYTGLNAAIELRHAGLLPVWITDLAGPDALFTWSKELPLIGNTFNLLPILLCVAMFLQTKFNPQMSQTSATATDQQKQQQKMMKFMMPAMMLVFFYKAPSGLTLYIMASTFASVGEQFFIRKHIREKQEAEAAMETTVRLPGKAPRGARPKKPKGPFWVKRG